LLNGASAQQIAAQRQRNQQPPGGHDQDPGRIRALRPPTQRDDRAGTNDKSRNFSGELGG